MSSMDTGPIFDSMNALFDEAAKLLCARYPGVSAHIVLMVAGREHCFGMVKVSPSGRWELASWPTSHDNPPITLIARAPRAVRVAAAAKIEDLDRELATAEQTQIANVLKAHTHLERWVEWALAEQKRSKEDA